MSTPKIIANQEENDIKKLVDLVIRNYILFLTIITISIIVAFLFNKYTVPVYKVSSSILIKEETKSGGSRNMTDYLNSSLLGMNQNFQNELFVLKSAPVIEETIKNLDLAVNYYRKDGLHYLDSYGRNPFHVFYAKNHLQPVNIKFHITLQKGGKYTIEADSKDVSFYNYEKNEVSYMKKSWAFKKSSQFGELIETPELSFLIQSNNNMTITTNEASSFYFELKDIPSVLTSLERSINFVVIDKLATVIQIDYRSKSSIKGKDIINELMDVYSKQNLERKNHTALITVDYIEKQLNEISESLNQTEDKLQSFRSSNQLLNITEQASGISAQYMDLQNQLAELVTRKRYYDYVSDYLSKNDDFSNIIVPASMGIPDQLLNNLMSELISAQAQRSNLITNKQERNPLVQKLAIQIENIKKTISENIASVQSTTEISIDEMNKRIRKVESEISRLPKTQRQLGGIERKYRLNDAIYNYLLEKRAEAKITQASNMPDNIIIEPAKIEGNGPISPNKLMNYLIALFLGISMPFGFLIIKSALNNKIEFQENIEKITDIAVLGKILHTNKKTNNIMFEYPKSNTAESFRSLRTNLEYHYKNIHKKVILVSSSIEGEGKSFNSLNIAMSYAQLGRKTILIDFDLRKKTDYFSNEEGTLVGLSTYYSQRANIDEIILHSQHPKMDYIPSGPIPPDPVELLALEATAHLFEELKSNYEIVIIDTPPLAQVTDAYLLIDYADIKVIIARCDYTVKKAFTAVTKDLKMKNIGNLCIVLNDNRIFRDQYGYGYGYNKKNT